MHSPTVGGGAPIDMAAIREAMNSPSFRAAAQRAGVNIDDPAVAVALANRARAMLPAQAGVSAQTSVAAAPSSTAASATNNSFYRSALRHYEAVAAM